MRGRPLDYFGPEDYYEGADPDMQMTEIKQRQLSWDAEYNQLPWWRRLALQIFGFDS